MLGRIVLVYPHPKLPADEPIAGIVTHHHGDATVDVTMLPSVGLIGRGGWPAAKPAGPMRVAASPLAMIPGYRGAWYCVPLEALSQPPFPLPSAKSKPAKAAQQK